MEAAALIQVLALVAAVQRTPAEAAPMPVALASTNSRPS
jgi:hypothetical protein